jgi:hypothetical protein
MKIIHIVYYDWACNGGSDEGILGCYESREDAVAKLDAYWQEQVEQGYVAEYDQRESTEDRRECWNDGRYEENHDLVEIREQYLYSREDVANGLA